MSIKWKSKAAKAIKSMQPYWFENINNRKYRKTSHDGRTKDERLFDSGVFAAAEFVRRITGDEDLFMAVLEVCIWKQRKREEESKREEKSK